MVAALGVAVLLVRAIPILLLILEDMVVRQPLAPLLVPLMVVVVAVELLVIQILAELEVPLEQVWAATNGETFLQAVLQMQTLVQAVVVVVNTVLVVMVVRG
jgi:hypothetical protein